jgi:flagellar basal-body rod protein FlgB
LTFDRELERALVRNDLASVGRMKPRLTEDLSGPERADGNNVDINREMAQLDQNTLVYRTFAQIMALRLATLRSAVTGR